MGAFSLIVVINLLNRYNVALNCLAKLFYSLFCFCRFSTTMSKELEFERQKSNLDSEELRRYLAGDKSNYYTIIQDILDRYPDLCNPSDLDYLHADRKEKYEIQAKRFAALAETIRNGEVDPQKEPLLFYALLVVSKSPVIGLHFGMVLPALQKLMTDEQWEEWGSDCVSFRNIFAYAQTEVGHGTWLSKLETTAEFDPSTDEFVINSNGITGYKYWPGYLAKGCSHALVMAQLIIKGHNHGPHLFVVPIRCTQTHEALPGIDEGDIGPTYAIFERDNGYVGFKNVRIPRRFMVMRYQSVDKEGNYKSEANQKLMFAAMLKIRSELVTFSSYLTTIGTVVATRYSIIRRQCELKPGQGEMKVIDYLTQQDKLYPAICLCLAFQTCHHQLQEEFNSVEAEIAQGNFEQVTHLHYLLAGLKGFVSAEALKRLTVLRNACGGHGFSLSSNIPPLIAEADAMCTYEGDNTVMHQQCARNLVRCFVNKTMGKQQTGFMAYLDRNDSEANLNNVQGLFDTGLLLQAYEQRARYLLMIACKSLQVQIEQNGCSQEDAWINSAILLVNASIAHSHLYVISHFIEALSRPDLSHVFKLVLRKVCVLYCLLGIRENLGEFLSSNFFIKTDTELIFEGVFTLYVDLRPHILKLAEAYSFPGIVINSTLGASDGRPYERLMEWSRKSTLNDQHFKADMFQKYIKPHFESKSKL